MSHLHFCNSLEMSRNPTNDPEIYRIQDDIDYHQTLINSLLEEPGTEERRRGELQEIDTLRKKLADRLSTDPRREGLPSSSRTTVGERTSGSNSSTVSIPSSTSSVQMELPTINLPNRKRDRSAFDDDNIEILPQPKSHRPSPSQSPAASTPVSTDFDFDFFDDPSLGNLLGERWQEDVRSNHKALRELEEKKKQQEADERFARQLQEEWARATSPPVSSHPSKSIQPSSSRTSQAFLKPDGALRLPYAASTAKPSLSMGSNQYNTHNLITLDDDDDDDDDDFEMFFESPYRNPASLHNPFPRRTSPSSFNAGDSAMPGAFPGALNTPYDSVPGGSVYLNPGYLGSTPAMRSVSGLPGFGSLPSLTQVARGISNFVGSSYNPVDIDSYRSYNTHSQAWDPVDPAKTQEEIRNLLEQIRPDDELTSNQAKQESPISLKVILMPHQLKGLAWMKMMEEGTNKGGILADDMGLGKTIQALALIVERPCPGGNKPTLIVAPVALMEQWAREIKKVVRRDLVVQVLHNTSARVPWSNIKHADVLLTTYGTLTSELHRKVKWDERLKMNPDAEPSKGEECPMLGDKSKFWRVVLDEAQAIKNRNTKAAAATNRLNSEYRWCLSGTPMQNNVDEMYSLIKFCRIRPYNDYDKFARDIGRPLKARVEFQKEKAMQQLQALLKAVLLRRTKKSKIDGQPILQLPEKFVVEERAVFSPDELTFYKQLETQAKIQFNRFVKNGTVGQNYSKALVLLLRLRQCCCSPQLITNTKDFITDSGVEGIDMIANARKLSAEVVTRLKQSEEVECPVCMDAIMNPVIFNPCGHNLCQDCLSKMVDNVMQEASTNISCPHCRTLIDTKLVTDHESFLRVHCPDRPGVVPLDEADIETASEDSDTEDEDEDDTDNKDVDRHGNLRDFVVPDEKHLSDLEVDEDDEFLKAVLPDTKSGNSSNATQRHKSTAKSKKGKGKDKMKDSDKPKSLAVLRKEGLRSKSAKRQYIKQLSKDFVTSTKIEKTIQLLHDIHDHGEGEKTIVFSSFTSFLDLLEVPLSQETELGDYTRYDGSMSAKERNESVLNFTDKPNHKIILVSIKAGNSGLNLTAANHVIILDPFWNPFVEYQAADRCYRIGQMREVTVHRVLIGEEGGSSSLESDFTVEDRILKLQEKKRHLVETALDENAGSSIARLGREELGYLFGVNNMPAQASRR